jgi:uncharacterized membrane protein
VNYAEVLALTLTVEVVIAYALTRSWLVVGVCLLVNALTHPVAWSLWSSERAPRELIECVVIAVEAAGYRLALRNSWRRAAGLALACNSLTWAASYWL